MVVMSRGRYRHVGVFLARIACLFAALTLLAATASDKERPVNIRVRSDLVLINTLVTDGHGRIVPDLDPRRFRLFEDDREQVIRYCTAEEMPVSVGLVIDTSGSMGEKLVAAKTAAKRLVRTANASDEFFVLEFRDHPRIVIPFTSDVSRLDSAIDSLEPNGSTALLDGIYLALHEVRRAQQARTAIVFVSDGMDNHSRYSLRDVKSLALEIDAPVYTLNLWEPARSGRYAIQRRDPGLLEEISRPTGGRSIVARDPKRLIAAADLIGSEIRHHYVLGYVPSNREADGKVRHVQIKVEPSVGPRLKLSYRTAYRAPVQ